MGVNGSNGAVNFCVLIPTYNNAGTLEKVILGVLEQTGNVIVVNDGSTDATAEILERCKGKVEVVSCARNRGKGWALRTGLRKAGELGYEYAITIDSDGQHFPSDVPKFLEGLRPGEDVLVIGNRDMTAEGVPPKSVFGRKFSNFWVKLETGLDMKDSQSGYRLYTVARMNRFHYFTTRYTFELESLVRWAWKGLPVRDVPIRVYYAPAGERVSHFKGFVDNFRISRLNTVLVAICIVYIWPRNALRALFRAIRGMFVKK